MHRVSVREDTGDLTLSFGDDLLLEALNMSSGYEAWQLIRAEGGTSICMVGGGLAIF
ncbi:DUF6188 family protein [Dongia deserti]|uniref:DUF6188 family protein n=1 Tax=Dongia deserti TaxID=2268030 RepID=UPI0013C4583C|nr:DUF6188 family protein [Dongia deserti]